jgi:hypothetical protein
VHDRAHSLPRESESSDSKQRIFAFSNESNEKRPSGSTTPPHTQRIYSGSSSHDRGDTETVSEDRSERQNKELESYSINEVRSRQGYEIEQARTILEQKKSDLSREEYELEKTELELRSYKLQKEYEEDERLTKEELRKLRQKEDVQEEKRRLTGKRIYLWFCCQCGDGPSEVTYVSTCLECDHPRCGDCTVQTIKA